MNRREKITALIGILLVAAVCSAQIVPSVIKSGFWKKQGSTISPANGESVAIRDSRLGVSQFGISADTVLTTAEIDGRVYYLTANTKQVTLPTPTTADLGKMVSFMEGNPVDSGVTFYAGSGVSQVVGSGPQETVAAKAWNPSNSGASGWAVTYMVKLRNGALVYWQLPNSTTWQTTAN